MGITHPKVHNSLYKNVGLIGGFLLLYVTGGQVFGRCSTWIGHPIVALMSPLDGTQWLLVRAVNRLGLLFAA